jgi:hypothetical protein
MAARSFGMKLVQLLRCKSAADLGNLSLKNRLRDRFFGS